MNISFEIISLISSKQIKQRTVENYFNNQRWEFIQLLQTLDNDGRVRHGRRGVDLTIIYLTTTGYPLF